MDPKDFALLKVIESIMKNIEEDVKEIKGSLKTKVEYADFHVIKQDVEDLKKSKWMTMGVAGTISFIISHFWK